MVLGRAASTRTHARDGKGTHRQGEPVKEQEGESSEQELWLHVALDITNLSKARAWAADVYYCTGP